MTNYLRKLLITGAYGQVASALQHHARAQSFQLIALSRSEMDITDKSSIEKALKQHQPDIMINTAAYTAVDKAEQEQDAAMKINCDGAANLAAACHQSQIPLIHLSTDYVFDGTKHSPYCEEDAINPINFYGKSKWLGEQAIRNECTQHIILRVSGVFGHYGNNFMKTMLRLASERHELRVVADQFTCPTNANDIADTLFTLANNPTHWGTYHYCNTPAVSWHGFASAIIAATKQRRPLLVEEIKAITTADYPTLAKRPAYSVLDCRKIAKDYGVLQIAWDKAL